MKCFLICFATILGAAAFSVYGDIYLREWAKAHETAINVGFFVFCAACVSAFIAEVFSWETGEYGDSSGEE